MAGTLPDEAGVHDDPLFSEDSEAAEAARDIKACLAIGDTSKALLLCDQMLSVHPDSRLFEGLKLEVENREREIRLEYVRRLDNELENTPDLDARIDAIQHALIRYPAESQLSQLLKNAIARRDLLNSLLEEARIEEQSDGYAASLRRWYLIRELYPAMPGMEDQIRRLESLADTQRRLRRRAEFVDTIFRLSSTGDYTRAVYQCINALSEYPNDGGLMTLKRSVEEKAQHATELQTFISDGLTFLQNQNIDAALECFGKAKGFDQSNLQVRYLIGIALLEKARVVMNNDRRKLNQLLNEARSFVPNHPELQTLSFDLDEPASGPSGPSGDDNWEEQALVRIEHPAAALSEVAEQAPPPEPEVEPPAPSPPPSEPPAPQARPFYGNPIQAQKDRVFQRAALFALVFIGALTIGWLVYSKPASEGVLAVPILATVEIKATPPGAEIFVDSQRVGESQVTAQLSRGSHTVTASLAGYTAQTLPLEVGADTKGLQIDLRPILLDVNVVSDLPGADLWVDGEIKGHIAENGITISGVEPGVRVLKIVTPDVGVEMSLDFQPGRIPVAKALPSRQIANVLVAGSVDGRSHVECNCAPAGLRVGEVAEIIRAGGLEVPLEEGQHRAELWLGKNRRKLTIQGSRSPVATIAVFSNVETAGAKEDTTESSSR